MTSKFKWKERAKHLTNEVFILSFAIRDNRVPWYAKALAGITIAYALSPVDLIPDFIPVLGYLDDLILIPLGIYLTIKMIPEEVLTEYRQRAKTETITSKAKWISAILVVSIWVLIIYVILEATLIQST